MNSARFLYLHRADDTKAPIPELRCGAFSLVPTGKTKRRYIMARHKKISKVEHVGKKRGGKKRGRKAGHKKTSLKK